MKVQVTDNLWLEPIPANLRDRAIAALDAGDAMGFLGLTGSTERLELVYRNMGALRTRGVYEAALLDAFTATTQTNNHWMPLSVQRNLFRIADLAKLRAAGDPLPGPGPFTLYRGVAGRGPSRRVRGLSWTADREQARWFAKRFTLIGLADPAVFQVMAHEPDVLAYCNGRSEQEFITRLPPEARPRRIERLE